MNFSRLTSKNVLEEAHLEKRIDPAGLEALAQYVTYKTYFEMKLILRELSMHRNVPPTSLVCRLHSSGIEVDREDLEHFPLLMINPHSTYENRSSSLCGQGYTLGNPFCSRHQHLCSDSAIYAHGLIEENIHITKYR
jgi:hypothetical protein